MIVDLPKPTELMKTQNKALYDYLYSLTETLNFALNNLDTENISGLLASSIKGADATSQYVNSVLNSNNLAKLVGTQIISDDGVVFLDTYTMMCYGTLSDGTTVTFKSPFGAIPAILVSPSYNISISTSGFEVHPKTDEEGVTETISLNYLAIGRRP